jgi:acyl-CoA reductase-like NAD-dependent aldehyde dehydrogenase
LFESGVWHDKPGSERAKIMWRIADLMDQRASDVAELDSLNTGMPLAQAQLIVPTCAEFFRYYAGWCTKVDGNAHDVRMTGGISGTYANMHAYGRRRSGRSFSVLRMGKRRDCTRASFGRTEQ